MPRAQARSPGRSPNPSSYNLAQPQTMDFPDAMREVIDGNKVTKLEWENEGIYVCLNGGWLRIMMDDGAFHNLLVSDGDMMGDDWVVI